MAFPGGDGVSTRNSFGIVDPTERDGGYDTEIGPHLQGALMTPITYDTESTCAHVFCRVNAYTSESLIRGDCEAIRAELPVYGAISMGATDVPTPRLTFSMIPTVFLL